MQALDLFEELRSKIGIAQTRCCLGHAEHELGHAGGAARHVREALTLAHEIGRYDLMAAALEGSGALPLPTTRRPVPSCSALPPIRTATGVHRSVIEGHDPNDAEHHAQSALGGAQFAAAASSIRRLRAPHGLPSGSATSRPAARRDRTPRQ